MPKYRYDPDPDTDPDPVKIFRIRLWILPKRYGSDRIRIRIRNPGSKAESLFPADSHVVQALAKEGTNTIAQEYGTHMNADRYGT